MGSSSSEERFKNYQLSLVVVYSNFKTIGCSDLLRFCDQFIDFTGDFMGNVLKGSTGAGIKKA
jgi:hypothetical protein